VDTGAVIDQTAAYVREATAGEGSGHDWWHIYRVWQNALVIARAEGADPFVTQLAALLHDIADWKFHDGDETVGPRIAGEWGGDWRMVVLDGEGFPLSYTPRSLTAEEQEADERADLFDKAQQLLSQIDATVASHQAIVDDWETLTTGEQIAHLNTLTQVQIKELQVLKYFIKKGL